MPASGQSGVSANHGAGAWQLPTAVALGIAVPILGTILLGALLPGWNWQSLPFHSTLEVGGATIGLVLAALILAARQVACTSRRMWIACALISMAVPDICHSCVPAGVAFVWLHSWAVLAGGVFFALVWFPDREIARGSAWATAGAVLLVTVLIGGFSMAYPKVLPAMVAEGEFTPVANAINFVGGGLTVLAALSFGVHYFRTRGQEDLLFLLLCLLFGVSGVLFQMSSIWETGWWFWHVLRFAGYFLALCLAMLAYRTSENEMARAHSELDSLFHAAVDGKRIVSRDFEQVRVNDTFAALSGVRSEAALGMKCHAAFRGPLCHTDDCPVKQFEAGAMDQIEREVTKTTRDGREVTCVLNAVPLLGTDGSFQGVIESFWDITDRKEAEGKLQQQNAMRAGQTGLSDAMRGDLALEALCRNIVTFLCKHIQAQTGLMYLTDEAGNLRLVSSYAHKRRKHLATTYKLGEGLVGQAALEKEDIVLTNVPDDYIAIESGLGEAPPRNIYVKVVVHNDQVKAVLEIGTLTEFSESQSEFLDLVAESLAVALESAQSRASLATSLGESQRLSEELQAQQEELQATNEELEEQTQLLKTSEEKLKAQQEELQVANEELEERNEALERQKQDIEQANRELDRTRCEIEQKAEELAIASKYKSEFLANMSHELRTPLNSLLILAKSLSENRDANLTDEQVESAGVIYSSGDDLLSLINEILDLSKIEAGRLELQIGEVALQTLADSVAATFQHMAEEKGLTLEVSVADTAPASIVTDGKRADQIVRNLMSNAIKFTDKGGITVTFDRPGARATLAKSGLQAEDAVAITVADTGIGIPADKQKVIFEAFQQAEGGTARKYGGTGLGLSISRELAGLLGGEIQLESQPGRGATFTVHLPIDGPETRDQRPEVRGQPSVASGATSVPDLQSSIFNLQSSPSAVPDDRDTTVPGETVVLIIEDDAKFAKILVDRCHDRGLKCLTAGTGEDGLTLAEKHQPKGIILDIRLPGMDGWAVLNVLKENPNTRHIPVHIMSVEEASMDALRKGAIGYLTKPATQEELQTAFGRLEEEFSKEMKELLVVEDDETLRKNILDLIGNGDVHAEALGTGAAAIQMFESRRFDCMILDLGLPDMSGFELLKRLDAMDGVVVPPVIVYTGRELTREENTELSAYAESIIIKGVRSEERLLDEASLFLHRVVADLPAPKRQIITDLHDTDSMLRGKRVLIVDDDMRNVFALSRELADRGLITLKAEDGQRALEVLENEPRVDLVLMDIMMPVMDGYETIRQIRDPQSAALNHDVPIIALTAKAMKDDRERCIAAGASDYLAKPVDIARLLSMMRVWLYR